MVEYCDTPETERREQTGNTKHTYTLEASSLLDLQLLPAPCECAPATAPAGSNQGYGLGQAMAVVHTRDGGQVDGPRVVTERSPPISGAAVATATDSLKTGLS